MAASMILDFLHSMSASATLDSLYDGLERLNKAAPDPGLKLDGIAYDKSFNDSFAINKEFQDNFTVYAPWGTFAREDKIQQKEDGSAPAPEEKGERSFPTPTQQALIDVVTQSIKKDDTECFIDIATLSPSADFWCEGEDKSVIATIGAAIDQLGPNVKPLIRFLVGDEGAKARKDYAPQWMMNNIFWSKGPRIRHPNARLYAGFYSPNFHPGDTQHSAVKFIRLMKQRLEKEPRFAKMLQSFNFEEYLDELVKVGVRHLSWNHAKIFAVNGKCIYTGGTNFYSEYCADAKKDKTDIRIDHNIVDHGVKLVGDAAVAGHKWADYFWNYLDNPADTDDICVCWAAKLSDDGPSWFTRDPKASQSVDVPNVPEVPPIMIQHATSPSSTDKVNSIPPEVKQNPFKKTNKFDPAAKQIKTLTVGKLGDWHGTMNDLTYPVMIIDLVRDVALNLFWQINASLPDGVWGLGGQLYGLNLMMSDDMQKDMLFKEFKITPVAWASRHAMTKAIAYATTSVIICQQCIVQTQTAKDETFKKGVDRINANKALGITAPWDGFIWPFDHLIAIAQALGKISTNTSKGAFTGVYIVLATKDPLIHDGWEDQTSIARFKRRLKRIMLGLTSAAGGVSEKQIDKALKEHLHIRRVGKDDGRTYSHSKIVCVDKKLMYVGSDNMYPCYNEEHGVWVEDGKNGPYPVADWINTFFDPYFNKRCTEPTDADEDEWFKKGGKADKRFYRENN